MARVGLGWVTKISDLDESARIGSRRVSNISNQLTVYTYFQETDNHLEN